MRRRVDFSIVTVVGQKGIKIGAVAGVFLAIDVPGSTPLGQGTGQMRGTVFQGTAFLGTIVAGEERSPLWLSISTERTPSAALLLLLLLLLVLLSLSSSSEANSGQPCSSPGLCSGTLSCLNSAKHSETAMRGCKKKERRKDLTKSPAVIIFDVRGVLDVEEFDGSPVLPWTESYHSTPRQTL
jgi:hypothetical protein